MYINSLSDFISIETIAGKQEANKQGIDLIKSFLIPLGFEVTIEGDSPHYQPVIIAKYKNIKSEKKVVLYSHYDVEKIKKWEKWDTNPFELIEKDGRYYCRGIADNKGILVTRLLSIKEMFEAGEEIPNILWIIQGEEEVAGETPWEVIPKHFAEFKAKIYVEETGVFKDDNTPVIFHMPKAESNPSFLDDLNATIYSGMAIYENRTLTKFSKCPFFNNIPANGYYIGFGPNDSLCNIHKDNESISIQKLTEHKEVFKKFIRWINTTTLNEPLA